MALVKFKNLPDESTPLNDTNLNNNFNDLLDLIHPVGSIYISVNDISPETLYGGTWEQIKDTFLLACGDTYNNKEKGGSSIHQLTIEEMPAHNHNIALRSGAQTGNFWSSPTMASNTGSETSSSTIISSVGGSQPFDIMPPYLAVYMWKRIA